MIVAQFLELHALQVSLVGLAGWQLVPLRWRERYDPPLQALRLGVLHPGEMRDEAYWGLLQSKFGSLL